MVWHKPYFVEVSPDTFSIVEKVLDKFGKDWKTPSAPFKNQLEQETFILSVLKILAAHFDLTSTSLAAGDIEQHGKIPAKEKSALERTLYRLESH